MIKCTRITIDVITLSLLLGLFGALQFVILESTAGAN
jgi:hypothetical protein